MEAMHRSRGARQAGETLTNIPATAALRPLRDTIILEPLDVIYSQILVVYNPTKPLRGKVLAVGPGTYPKRYDHPEKHKRTRMWDSKRFLPTEVRVGDIVELGGAELEGYAFETFAWGTRQCLICTERDICGVIDPEPLAEGAAA